MKFKGSIVITDPCYIMKNNSKSIPVEYEKTRPKSEDYMSFAYPKDYPDAVPKERWEYEGYELDRISREKEFVKRGLKVPIYVPMKSKQYEEDFQCLINADFEWKKPYMSDWELSKYGESLSIFGFSACMISTTYYGDWGCSVYNTATKEKLGEFCADAGMVGVFLLEEVLKYNPEFQDYIDNRPWCVTVIEDFDGKVNFKVTKEKGGVHKEDGRGYRKGEIWYEKTLEVVGTGSVNFISIQTSL